MSRGEAAKERFSMESEVTTLTPPADGPGLKKQEPAAEVEKLVCTINPDHGPFKNKQGLALHMRRAHGAGPARKSRFKETPKPAAASTEFDAKKALQAISPNGHIKIDHYHRVTAWLKEAEELHGLLRK